MKKMILTLLSVLALLGCSNEYTKVVERYNGLICNEHYVNDKIEGKYTCVDKSGNLAFTGTYRDGKPHGVFDQLYKNGRVKIRSEYRDGKLDGKKWSLLEDGNPLFEMDYKDHKLMRWVAWYDNGNKSFDCQYKNLKRHGVCIDWDMDENRISEEVYKNGKLVRKVM